MIVTVDSLLIYEATALGYLTQLIFELNAIKQLGGAMACFRLVKRLFLPIFVAVYAILGAEMAELAHDGMQYPPFRRARASFIVAIMARKGGVLDGELHRGLLRMIDFFFTWLLLIFMFAGVIVFEVVP